ncbi:MAG: peptide deformylase [Patescibacteria group bacterium]|jgi:methionyl-tRNA formyltransferase
MKLDIFKNGSPILRTPTETVTDFDMELQKTIDDMIETMRGANGIGLAAPQIGSSKKLLVCEFAGDEESKIPAVPLTVLCNPEIVQSSDELKNMVEGCLSFPGMELIVKRPKKVKVKGFDRYGEPIEIEADNLYARVLQHEIDHLNCTLLVDHLEEVDVIFIGTGTLGVPALNALATDPQYRIKLVITGENLAVSRTHADNINPIEETAKKYKIPILKTKNIKDPETIEKIKATKPKIGIMADFGQIVSEEILNIPEFGIINIHPSLLPKYRGPSPIQQPILDGVKTTGVSLILTAKKMDAGDLVSQTIVKLQGSETSTILKNFLAEVAATQLLNSLPYYIAGDLKPEPQGEKRISYTRLFTKEDGLVTETTPAVEVERKIRAFDAWPKVYTMVKGKRVQLLSSHFDKENNFFIDRVKPEGKSEMSYEDFVRGYHTEIKFSESR